LTEYLFEGLAKAFLEATNNILRYHH